MWRTIRSEAFVQLKPSIARVRARGGAARCASPVSSCVLATRLRRGRTVLGRYGRSRLSRQRAGCCSVGLGVVGSVEEMAAVDERGGAATVEVDGLTGAEVGHQLGELGERESGVDAGPSAVTGECDQLVSGGTESGSWVAAEGDVRVELVGAGGESLWVVQVAEEGSLADEHWPGLQQVAGWAWRQLGTRADVDRPLVDVDRRPRSSVRVENRLRLDPAAADPQLAQRRPVRADEEAADDRFSDAGSSAPRSSRWGPRSARRSASSAAAGSARRRRLSPLRLGDDGGEAHTEWRASASAPASRR